MYWCTYHDQAIQRSLRSFHECNAGDTLLMPASVGKARHCEQTLIVLAALAALAVLAVLY